MFLIRTFFRRFTEDYGSELRGSYSVSSLQARYAAAGALSLSRRASAERLPFGVCVTLWIAMSSALWALILLPFFA